MSASVVKIKWDIVIGGIILAALPFIITGIEISIFTKNNNDLTKLILENIDFPSFLLITFITSIKNTLPIFMIILLMNIKYFLDKMGATFFIIFIICYILFLMILSPRLLVVMFIVGTFIIFLISLLKIYIMLLSQQSFSTVKNIIKNFHQYNYIFTSKTMRVIFVLSFIIPAIITVYENTQKPWTPYEIITFAENNNSKEVIKGIAVKNDDGFTTILKDDLTTKIIKSDAIFSKELCISYDENIFLTPFLFNVTILDSDNHTLC